MFAFFASALLLTSAVQEIDTTVAVRAGSRLQLNNFEGSVTIRTWTKSAVRIQADPEDEGQVAVSWSGSTLSVRSEGRYGPETVDYELTVPADINLAISGQSGDVTIDGTKGEISVETVEGEIRVNGGGGLISLRSVDGGISLAGARGSVDLNSVDGEIRLTNVAGEVRVQTVDGAITLDEVESSNVDAQSVDGEIDFRGPIKEGGRYRLVSHDGGVTVSTPAINATVSVATYSGDFESDFPVTLSGIAPGKRMTFTMGSGSARLEIESFDGSVSLRKTSR